jgi:hypothetical protein
VPFASHMTCTVEMLYLNHCTWTISGRLQPFDEIQVSNFSWAIHFTPFIGYTNHSSLLDMS